MTQSLAHRMTVTIALVILLTAVVFTAVVSAAEDTTLLEIQEAIEEKGARWTAGETSVSELSPEEQEMLFGLKIDQLPTDIPVVTPPALIRGLGAPLPYGDFDWRNNSGQNWMTSVKNQFSCGSCWAFASLGVIEAVINIENNNPDIDVDLSEQHLVSDCCDAGDCGGGYCSEAVTYIMNNGVPDETCYPYLNSDSTCEESCQDWEGRAWKINNAYILNGDLTADYKWGLENYGPMIVALNSDTDFPFYTGGIYEPVLSDGWGAVANHAVVLVGYNDTDEYWIIKNSWGEDWGEDGYGKVAYGALEQYTSPWIPIVVDNTTGPSPSPPVISSPTHPDEDLWYTNRGPTFNWTIPSDFYGIDCYSYLLDHSPTTIPDETCNTTENSTVYADLTDDIWYFHVRAKNNLSIWGLADHYRVKIDANDPVINSVGLNKSTVNASEPILVSINATDPGNGGNASGIANVTANGVELTPQAGNLWNGTITAETSLGLHNVTVNAYDNASHTAINDTVQYTVGDLEPPEITNLTATPAFINLSSYTLVSATVVDPHLYAVYLVVANADEILLRSHNITQTNVSKVYNGTWNATQCGVTNGSTRTGTPVTTEKEGESYSVDGYFQQNQTASEENATAVFYANYSLEAVYPYVGAEPKGIEPGNSTFKPYSMNISTEPPESVNLTTLVIGNLSEFKLVQETSTDGIYTVGIEANDTFGNNKSSYTDVTVDTTPPEVSITDGPTGTITYNDVTFKWTGSDNSTLVYQYKLDGSWSAWISATSKPYTDLANGEYTFTVKAKDQAGNEASASKTFTVSVTHKVSGGGGGGGGPTLDSDGDGYSDPLERLMGTDPNDPNDHPGEQAAPSGSMPASTPKLQPTMPATQTPAITATPTPTPATATPTPGEPGFEAGFAIAGLLAVAYLAVRGKLK